MRTANRSLVARAITAFLRTRALYKQFHLDEPWDSEHNKTLIEKIPAVYACPSAKLKPGLTTYMVPVGERTIFSGKDGMPLKEITDGTSNTLLLVEVPDEHAVTWTKPEDSPIDPEKGFRSSHAKGFVAALADGSVRFLSDKIDPKIFKLLLDPAMASP